MIICRNFQRANGFTLLEVLISIALFSLVVSSVYGAYRATFQTVNGSERQAVASAAARVILERISADLVVIATDQDSFLEGKRGDIDGRRADGLSCVSYAHVSFSRTEKSGGRTALVYTAKENESGLIDLYRLDSPIRPGEESEENVRGEILGKDLLSFQLTYISGDGEESDEWNSSSGEGEPANENTEEKIQLPVLVRVEIMLASSPDDETGTIFRTAVALPIQPEKDTEG